MKCSLCCCSVEPIPAVKEAAWKFLFWGLVVAFIGLYAVLIDKAVEENKTFQKPPSLGRLS